MPSSKILTMAVDQDDRLHSWDLSVAGKPRLQLTTSLDSGIKYMRQSISRILSNLSSSSVTLSPSHSHVISFPPFMMLNLTCISYRHLWRCNPEISSHTIYYARESRLIKLVIDGRSTSSKSVPARNLISQSKSNNHHHPKLTLTWPKIGCSRCHNTPTRLEFTYFGLRWGYHPVRPDATARCWNI